MENFTFLNPTKIVFGRDAEASVGSQVVSFSKKILLHLGGGSAQRSGLYDKIVASLRTSSVSWVELSGVKPNPRLSLVKEGIRICREQGLDFILAVGGGSVIDSAKAIALGVPYPGDIWDFYTGKAVPKEALPIGTVLTIPAAGSESSTGSVITNEEGWYKRAVNSDLIYPRFSILNPKWALSLTPYQSACGIVDMMAHLFERYFTNVQNVDLTDHLIEGVLKTIVANARILAQDPTNEAAMAEIMWSGTLAHNNLMDRGRVGDWASHGIEHELSGIYDVAHGAGLAVIFPAWMKFVYKHDVARFVQFAVRVWDVEQSFFSPERTAREGIARTEDFFRSLGMPVRLKDLGIVDDRLEEMASKCTSKNTASVGNFFCLRQPEVLEVLKLAQKGE